RVSKDEDGHRTAPHASRRIAALRGGGRVCASICAAMLLSMRARASGAFWPNEPNASHSGRPREGHPATHSASQTRVNALLLSRGTAWRGTHDHPPVVMGPGFRCARPGRRSRGSREEPTCGCRKGSPAPFRCFGPVLYNEECNLHVPSVERRHCTFANANPTLQIRASRNRAAQSYVRLFPMPAPWTSLVSLEPFAIASQAQRPMRESTSVSSRHPQGRHAPMARMTLDVNGKVHTIDADPDMPLLYALRNELSLNNPHFGCGL